MSAGGGDVHEWSLVQDHVADLVFVQEELASFSPASAICPSPTSGSASGGSTVEGYTDRRAHQDCVRAVMVRNRAVTYRYRASESFLDGVAATPSAFRVMNRVT